MTSVLFFSHFVWLTVLPDMTARVRLVTEAFDLKTGRPVYTEERVQYDDGTQPGLWTFVYRNEDGHAIVSRQVDFRKDALKPDFVLEDSRDGYLEGSETTREGIRVYARRRAGDAIREKLLSVPEPAVVDAGFNFFIEENWVRLQSGKKLYFNFVAPIEQDYFGFRLYRVGNTQVGGISAAVFHVDIDNFLLRLLVDPIVLTYNESTRQLLMYEGISNINNDKGKSHRVRMIFDYNNSR